MDLLARVLSLALGDRSQTRGPTSNSSDSCSKLSGNKYPRFWKMECGPVVRETTLSVSRCLPSTKLQLTTRSTKNKLLITAVDMTHFTNNLFGNLLVTSLKTLLRKKELPKSGLTIFYFNIQGEVYHFSEMAKMDPNTRLEFVRNLALELLLNWETFQNFPIEVITQFIFSDSEGSIQIFDQSGFFNQIPSPRFNRVENFIRMIQSLSGIYSEGFPVSFDQITGNFVIYSNNELKGCIRAFVGRPDFNNEKRVLEVISQSIGNKTIPPSTSNPLPVNPAQPLNIDSTVREPSNRAPIFRNELFKRNPNRLLYRLDSIPQLSQIEESN